MTRHHQRGFTLIEVIIFIVIVGIGLAGVLSVYTTSIKNSADPMVRKQTIAIAESLLEEVLQKSYCDPDTTDVTTAPPTCGAHTTEASRSLYDDVDDYNGYCTASACAAASTGIPDAAGNVNASLFSYSITSVTVGAPAAVTGGGATPLKKVDVTVTGPQGPISLTGYKGNY